MRIVGSIDCRGLATVQYVPRLEATVVKIIAQTLVAKYVVGVAHLVYTHLSGGILHRRFVPSVEIVVVVVVELIATVAQRRGHIARMADCVGYADGARYCLATLPSRCPVGIAAKQIGHKAELM